MAETDTLTYRGSEAVAIQKVLRNTYMLLSITLLWTAAMACVSMALEVPPMGFIPLLVAFGVLFAILEVRNLAGEVVVVGLHCSTAGGDLCKPCASGLGPTWFIGPFFSLFVGCLALIAHID